MTTPSDPASQPAAPASEAAQAAAEPWVEAIFDQSRTANATFSGDPLALRGLRA